MHWITKLNPNRKIINKIITTYNNTIDKVNKEIGYKKETLKILKNASSFILKFFLKKFYQKLNIFFLICFF